MGPSARPEARLRHLLSHPLKGDLVKEDRIPVRFIIVVTAVVVVLFLIGGIL